MAIGKIFLANISSVAEAVRSGLAGLGIVMHLLLGAVIDSDAEGYEYNCP